MKANREEGLKPGLHLRQKRNHWPRIFLALVIGFYVYAAIRWNPLALFGAARDDALYFSSAKALASGDGYILPSFPVRLAATKYPELYPALLAGVWKFDHHFPGNLSLAVALTLFLGCVALAFTFLLLRRWPGLNDWDALGVVVLCAFCGYFLDLSASVMSDVPFMAALLGAVWLAERGLCTPQHQPRTGGSGNCSHRFLVGPLEAGGWAVLGAGALAGLSIGFRTLGAAVVAGIGLVLLMRCEYRKLFLFSLVAAPIAVLMALPQLIVLVHPSAIQLAAVPGDSGWTQTLCYYKSYACGIQTSESGAGALRAVILTNLRGAIEQPALYLLMPMAGRWRVGERALVGLLSFGTYAGVGRYVGKCGRRAVPVLPVVLSLYLPVVVVCPWTVERYLVPLLPLLFGGLWVEGKHLFGIVRNALRSGGKVGERLTGGVLALGLLSLAAIIAVNYGYVIPAFAAHQATGDSKLLKDELGAYTWLRKHSTTEAKVIAYRDGLSYLYDERRSIQPIDLLTQAFFQNNIHYARRDAARLADVARYIGASYWLVTPDDFSYDSPAGTALLRKREDQILAKAPIVYRSPDGAVRLYDVRELFRNAGPARQPPAQKDIAHSKLLILLCHKRRLHQNGSHN